MTKRLDVLVRHRTTDNKSLIEIHLVDFLESDRQMRRFEPTARPRARHAAWHAIGAEMPQWATVPAIDRSDRARLIRQGCGRAVSMVLIAVARSGGWGVSSRPRFDKECRHGRSLSANPRLSAIIANDATGRVRA